MHHPTDRITHTTAFVTPVMEHWLEPHLYHDNRTNYTPSHRGTNVLHLPELYIYLNFVTFLCLCFYQVKSRTCVTGKAARGGSHAPTSWRDTTENTRATSRSSVTCATERFPDPTTCHCTWRDTEGLCVSAPTRRHFGQPCISDRL